ncbi:MAG: hypothetical protein LLG93_15275 [Deltaproteobacteria bacterium]|nr:hypothetical protein [Deltaproteobacteria bacterium]
MAIKLPYEPPTIIDLSGGKAYAQTTASASCSKGNSYKPTPSSQCSTGGSPAQQCVSGSTALGGNCQNGSVASAQCLTGSSAQTNECKAGSAAVSKCAPGSAAGSCRTGSAP